ncbi:hypothetical protein I4U23_014139 [Adineta vaga]|nr:hypothetical protein I4U23_014139 [Adineta vaga]
MLTCYHCRRSILRLSRKIWMILISISGFFFCITLISFMIFYFRIYLQSLKEELFIHQTNCTIDDIQSNNRSCDNQQRKTCQLIIGKCEIFNQTQNLILYSTWFDYESSLHQCTNDPCASSFTSEFHVNDSLFFVSWSNKSDHGYLKRISKLEIHIARIILIILACTFILSTLLSILFIIILSFYKKWEKKIYPFNAANPTASVYTRPPTIVVQKPSHRLKANINQRPLSTNQSTTSLQRLEVPSETILIASLEQQPRENLWRKTLQPLQISTLSGVVTTLREHKKNVMIRQNTIV